MSLKPAAGGSIASLLFLLFFSFSDPLFLSFRRLYTYPSTTL